MQVKIGFNKFPVPSITTDVPLYDIVTGDKLVDRSGTPLVAETELAVGAVARANKSTSVVIDPSSPPIKIAEVFRQTSETSTSLLGIPRAESQLSLFADVSSTGLDENQWEVYNFTGGNSYGPWDNRVANGFGAHYDAQMSEEVNEQAIRIGCFPVPYSFPFPADFADQGLYNETLFNQFALFVELGNVLWTHFSSSQNVIDYGAGFKDKFLNPSNVYVLDNKIVYDGVTEDRGLTLIDEWTRTWVDIRSNRLRDPRDQRPITAEDITQISGIDIATTRPGYSSSNVRFSFMQSRKAFRYQPGRISGFTFGAKTSTDSGSSANIIEWGVTNPTDQYVFQIRGANFSIVRRSTIPLGTTVTARQGIDPESEIFTPNGDPFDVDPATGELRKYYEVTIPRDSFNADSMKGNGPSGYLLNPALVTMYKIEFGWYGAIGARFYAYVPIDNGEGRWVLMHTIVIENSLGQPCLEDPFFRFSYSARIQDTSTLRTPQFIYKYGASVYIDGGDEGTVTQHSYSSNTRTITSANDKALIGVYAKPVITNQSGFSKSNKKIIFPKEVSVTSDSLARIKVVRCKACPGFAHNYNLGLTTGVSGRNVNIRFVGTRNRITIVPVDPVNPTANELFQLSDIGSKLIADGLWSGYIADIDTDDEDNIERDGSNNIIGYIDATIERIVNNYEKQPSSFPARVRSITNGSLFEIPTDGTTYPFPVRLSNYNAVAGSTVPLTGTKIKIQFLNPTPGDDFAHFAEFLLGVTDKRPVDDFGTLKWSYGVGDLRPVLPLSDVLFGEWTQSTAGRDRNGFETSESNYPRSYKMELDYRIPRPEGPSTGICSAMEVEVLEKGNVNCTLLQGNPDPAVGGDVGSFFLQTTGSFPTEGLIGGEIGISNVGTGVTFASEVRTYTQDNTVYSYVKISAIIPGKNVGDIFNIQFTPITITGNAILATKVFNFNPFPLYLVAMLRDRSMVYSITTQETIGDTTTASSPKWILNNNIALDTVGGLAQTDLAPVNFVEQSRLDSAAVDLQLEQQLRPSKVLDTFFVGKNETARVKLNNVFGSDRENITTDLLNIEATFITGSVVPVPGEPSVGTVQISLNTSEQ